MTGVLTCPPPMSKCLWSRNAKDVSSCSGMSDPISPRNSELWKANGCCGRKARAVRWLLLFFFFGNRQLRSNWLKKETDLKRPGIVQVWLEPRHNMSYQLWCLSGLCFPLKGSKSGQHGDRKLQVYSFTLSNPTERALPLLKTSRKCPRIVCQWLAWITCSALRRLFGLGDRMSDRLWRGREVKVGGAGWWWEGCQFYPSMWPKSGGRVVSSRKDGLQIEQIFMPDIHCRDRADERTQERESENKIDC